MSTSSTLGSAPTPSRHVWPSAPSDLCRPALWDPRGGLGGVVPQPVARGLARFQSWMQRHHIDPERDYARFYEHYLLKLPPEHLEILDEDLVRTMALVGSPEECREQIKALAQAGGTDFGLILGGNAHELMRRFAYAVIVSC